MRDESLLTGQNFPRRREDKEYVAEQVPLFHIEVDDFGEVVTLEVIRSVPNRYLRDPPRSLARTPQAAAVIQVSSDHGDGILRDGNACRSPWRSSGPSGSCEMKCSMPCGISQAYMGVRDCRKCCRECDTGVLPESRRSGHPGGVGSAPQCWMLFEVQFRRLIVGIVRHHFDLRTRPHRQRILILDHWIGCLNWKTSLVPGQVAHTYAAPRCRPP